MTKIQRTWAQIKLTTTTESTIHVTDITGKEDVVHLDGYIDDVLLRVNQETVIGELVAPDGRVIKVKDHELYKLALTTLTSIENEAEYTIVATKEELENWLLTYRMPKFACEPTESMFDFLQFHDEPFGYASFKDEYQPSIEDVFNGKASLHCSICNRLDTDYDEVTRKFGIKRYVSIKPNTSLAKYVTRNNVIYKEAREYYVELVVLDDRIRVYLRYNKILGSRGLFEFFY